MIKTDEEFMATKTALQMILGGIPKSEQVKHPLGRNKQF